MLDSSLTSEAKEQRTDSLNADLVLFRVELERGDYSAARLRADALLSRRAGIREIKRGLCFAGYDHFQGLLLRNRAEAEKLAIKFQDLQWRYWLLP